MSTAALSAGFAGPPDRFAIPAPPRRMALRRQRRAWWREAMAASIAGLVLSLLVGEFLLLLAFGF